MLMLLRERNLCVGALACRLGLTQGAVSQHLKILRDAGLVTAERDGYYVHYRVNAEHLAQWRDAIDELLGLFQAGQGGEGTTDGEKPKRYAKHEEEPCEKEKGDRFREGRSVSPGDCPPERIRECHGSEGDRHCASEGEGD